MPKADAATQPEVVPTEQAVPLPPEAQAALEAASAPPTPPPHPTPARRAHFKGSVNEYPSPLLLATREANGAVTERILYTPARDLDDDEWQAMPPEQRDYIKRSYGHLYDVDDDPQVHEPRRSTKHKGE